MLKPNEIIYYMVPEDYDYMPSKLKLLLAGSSFESWKQIHMTIIEEPCETWPSIRNGNQFDDPNWIEEVLWPLVCITQNVKIFNKVSKFKKNQSFKQISSISREEFKNGIHHLIPYSNYLCILFEDNNEGVELVAYYQAGEELYFFFKPDYLKEVKDIMDLHAKETTCWEYERYVTE